jgi:hypothetical protein
MSRLYVVDCLYRQGWIFRANVARPLTWQRVKSGIGHQVPMVGHNCVTIRIFAEDAPTAKRTAMYWIHASRWLSWVINIYERPEVNYEARNRLI